MARLSIPICAVCDHLQRDHVAGSGHCQAKGDCRCLKFKRANGRSNKFNAKRVAGFDSKAEHDQWNELLILQRGGYLTELRHHVTFDVEPPNCERITWKVDFTYVECATGKLVALEYKGAEGEGYLIKRKLFRCRYPEIELRITTKDRSGRIVADPREARRRSRAAA